MSRAAGRAPRRHPCRGGPRASWQRAASRSSPPTASPRPREKVVSRPGAQTAAASSPKEDAAWHPARRDTRVIVQGFTGKIGSFHAQEMIALRHQRRRRRHARARAARPTSACRSSTPCGRRSPRPAPPPASSSCRRPSPPIRSWRRPTPGIELCVAITDGIPAQDMIRVKRYMRRYKREERMRADRARTAPASSARARRCSASCPATSTSRAAIGIVGRSGTLGYEAAAQMKALGIGISTSVGIGGDPDQRQLVQGRPRAVRGGSRDRGRDDDRRDRRAAGSRGRASSSATT